MEPLQVIARAYTDFPDRFGIPRQSGLVEELEGTIVFEKEYRNRDMLRGLEDFSHIWLIWYFSGNAGRGWTPMVRPPRLGGNERRGVFATRSPFRPNGLGLSSVRLLRVEETADRGPVLHVRGVDMMDGTPVVDIKPYVPGDAHPKAAFGFAGQHMDYHLQVDCPEACLKKIAEEKRAALLGVLAQDPRPSYQEDPKRVYGMKFAGYEVRFRVQDGTVTVTYVEDETTSG